MDYFHRLTEPTYFVFSDNGIAMEGGESGVTYDYINDPPGNGDPGASAPVNTGKHASGTNQGSYFIGYQDQATSANANRPAYAVAQGLEHIDNILHVALAIPTKSAMYTAGGSETSRAISDRIYRGTGAITDIYKIVDSSGNEILVNSSGIKCQVTAVAALSGSLSADGFYDGGVTFTISPAVPNGTNYHILYGARSNLARVSPDMFIRFLVESRMNISEVIEQRFRALHGVSPFDASQFAWDDTWKSTIADLAFGGLNDRYGRTTVSNSGKPETWMNPNYDDSNIGSGHFIERTGPALSVYTSIGDLDGGTHSYTDPFNALFRSIFWTGKGVGTTSVLGDVGFLVNGGRRRSNDETEDYNAPGLASFLAVESKSVANGTSAADFYTRLKGDANATISEVSGELEVTLTDADAEFYDTGTTKTSIAVGHDLLEIRGVWNDIAMPNIDIPAVFVISELVVGNNKKCKVRQLSGKPVTDFVSSAVSVKVRWHAPYFSVGDGGPEYYEKINGTGTSKINLKGFFYSRGSLLSATSGNRVSPDPARFFAQDSSSTALEWGYHVNDVTTATSAKYTPKGYLYGDGSIQTTKVKSSIYGTNAYGGALISLSGSQTLNISDLNTNAFAIVFGQAGAAVTFTTISLPISSMTPGDRFDIFFVADGSTPMQISSTTTTWPSDCMFENSADRLLSNDTSVIDHYSGVVVVDSSLNNVALMTVRRYY